MGKRNTSTHRRYRASRTRGVASAEYAILLAVVASTALFGTQKLGRGLNSLLLEQSLVDVSVAASVGGGSEGTLEHACAASENAGTPQCTDEESADNGGAAGGPKGEDGASDPHSRRPFR